MFLKNIFINYYLEVEMELLLKTVASVKEEINVELQEAQKALDEAQVQVINHCKILDSLVDECVIIDDATIDKYTINDPVKANEEVIATINDRIIKCLWAVRESLRIEGKEKIEHNETLPKKLKKSKQEMIALLKEDVMKTKMYDEIFWKTLRQIIPSCPNSIGLKANWQVVKCQED